MNSLFHKLITLMLKATEVFARLHCWYFCSKGLEQLRRAETELHAVGRPPTGTSAERLSVKVGGFFCPNTEISCEQWEESYKGNPIFCCYLEPVVVFSSESYLYFTVYCFSGVLSEH